MPVSSSVWTGRCRDGPAKTQPVERSNLWVSEWADIAFWRWWNVLIIAIVDAIVRRERRRNPHEILRCSRSQQHHTSSVFFSSGTDLISLLIIITIFFFLFFLLRRPSSKSPRLRRLISETGWNLADCSSSKYASVGGVGFRFNVKLSTWRPWCHFTQKNAATWWMQTQRLPGAMQQSAPVPDL